MIECDPMDSLAGCAGSDALGCDYCGATPREAVGLLLDAYKSHAFRIDWAAVDALDSTKEQR